MFNNRLCKITLFFIAIWVTKVSCAQGVAPNKQDGCLSMKTLESLVHVPAENAWYEFLSDEGYSSYVKDTIITDTVDFFPLRYRRTDYFFDGNIGDTGIAMVTVMQSLDGLSNVVSLYRNMEGKCNVTDDLKHNGTRKPQPSKVKSWVYIVSSFHGEGIKTYEFTVSMDNKGLWVICKLEGEIEEYVRSKTEEAMAFVNDGLAKARNLSERKSYTEALKVLDSLKGYYPPMDDTLVFWTNFVEQQRNADYRIRLEKTLDDKKWADAWEICNTLLTLDSDTVGVVYIRNLLRDWLNQKVFPFKSQSPEEYYYVRKQLQDVVNQEIRRNFGRNVQKMELDFHIQTDSVNKSVGVINLVSSSDKKQKLEARRNELRAAVDTIAKSINPVSEHKINIRTEDNIKADVTWSYTTQVVNKKDVRDSILASIIDTIEREYMYIDKQSKTELVEPDGSLKYVRIPKLPTKRVYTFGWINKELSRQDSVIKYNDIMLVDFETSLGASWMPSLFIPGLGTYNQNARSNVISRAFPFFLFAGVSVFGFLWEKDIDHPRYEINDDMNMNPLYIKNIGYFLGYGGLGIAATIYLNDLVEGISNSVKNIERSKKIRERLAKQGPIAIELQDVIIR